MRQCSRTTSRFLVGAVAFLGGTAALASSPTIDVLVLYTEAARQAAGGPGQIRSAIEEAVEHTNLTFGNSLLDARVRLADAREVGYRESSENALEDLFFLATSSEVAVLREVSRADLVALVKAKTWPTVSGIAVGMTRDQRGTAIAPAAFFVTSLDSFPGNFTHELGHNLGCNHEPAYGPPRAEAVYPDAFAHVVPGLFRTIMEASENSCPGCPKIPYFSNPEVSYLGRPTGVAGQRDNARTVRAMAPVVERFGELPGRLGFAVGAVEVDESSPKVTVEVFRTDGSIGEVSVDFATEDGSALAGEDYLPVAGTLTWGTGEADVLALRDLFDHHRRRVAIPILDDAAYEGDQTFSLVLSQPDGGAKLGREVIEVRIRDDEERPPDYEVEVFLRGPQGEVPGSLEPDCIPETVCVSGAVPGRSEVFVRVVGPKPNGFLWPTLVKFTTSEARVRIRRLATGEVKEYVLAGATPGSDLLPGRIDRTGFPGEPDPSGAGGLQEAQGLGLIQDLPRIGWHDLTERAAPAEAPPPPGAWLGALGLPGFEIQVRIAPAGGEPVATRIEPGCIPETACVSGALQGRSEVFIRVVGPKPNGYLWPTLVRFSTSDVEVWLRQQGTGEVRYYLLAGPRRGDDSLDGVFDRTGFLPR